ncbi:MAG: FAD-linked oxidase C-terminal domain-containing protein [bacterium]
MGKSVSAEIGRRIGSAKVHTAPEILTCYAYDATNLRCLPDAVVLAETVEDIQATATLCAQAGVPVIPRGAGTGFAGGTVPSRGGVVVSTERLNHILSIDRERAEAVVEPGVVNAALQTEAGKVGLMFPPDPSSLEVCTLGGNVAQDAGGPRALKYGVTRDYVLGVDGVAYGGRAIDSPCPPTGAGWDPITTLMVGSEGTLGIFTGIRLRLKPRPDRFATALAFLKTTRDAAEAVNLIFDRGVLPAAVELVDRECLDSIASFARVGLPAGAGCSLLVETDGAGDEARETMGLVEAALRGVSPIEVKIAASDRERENLWRMRRSVSPSLARIAPWKINEDVCVPRSRLPLLVDGVARLAAKYGLKVPTFGHAGDGNLHVNVMFDRRSSNQVARAGALADELFEVTLGLEGTISGEHGIGLTKMKHLRGQLGDDLFRVEQRIKRAFDPGSLLNPGKVMGPA